MAFHLMASERGNTPEGTRSKRFNASDADVTFKSSDGVLFSIHRKYIEANTSGAFPGPEFDTGGETVVLEETSVTLELLFSFVYPSRHPSLADTSFEVLAPVAEAAEKYEVFSAMNICHIRMINSLPQHAEAIMSYAAKHGYKEVVDQAAPLVVSKPIGDAVRLLPQHLIVPWMIYRQQWHDILYYGFTRLGSGHSLWCRNCGGNAGKAIFKELTLGNLVNIADIISKAEIDKVDCYECRDDRKNEMRSWGEEMARKVSEIQKFSTFF